VLNKNKWYILCDFGITSHITVKIWVCYLLFSNLPQYLLFPLLMLPPKKFASPPYFYARTKTVKNVNLKFIYNMSILHVMKILSIESKVDTTFWNKNKLKISLYFCKYYAKYCQRLYTFYVGQHIKFWALWIRLVEFLMG